MIPSADNNARRIDSTLTGEDVKMRIHEDATQHIMGILSDSLYEDPELACIREYATNARDAHIEAGQERQIEVSTPSELKPVLTIRDFGVGLDASDMREIYSAYGASTKRETDDQTGMLGLGCKSAFAYTDQFTVIGIKGGVRTTASVARDEQGAGVMKILAEDPTDEGNGVTVSIPAKRGNDIERKAQDFFRFWTPGTILLDGADPPELGGYELTPELRVIDAEANESDVIIMGGVPYPTDFLNCLSTATSVSGVRIVAFVPMGAVHFTPSREGLQMTPQTTTTIELLREDFNKARDAAMAKEMEAATSRPDALERYLNVRDRLFVGAHRDTFSADYEGHPVPTNLEYAGRPRMKVLPAEPPYYKHATAYTSADVKPENAREAVWILGFTNSTFSKSMREKIDGYCEANGIAHEGGYVLSPRGYVPRAAWLPDDLTILQWEDVKLHKVPRLSNGSNGSYVRGESMVGHYEVFTGERWEDRVPVGELNDGRQLLYTTGGYGSIDSELLPDGAMVVRLAENRVDKFLRLCPSAERWFDFTKRRAAEVWKAATEAQRATWQFEAPHPTWSDPLARLDASEVKDPALAALIERCRAKAEDAVGDLRIWQHYLATSEGTPTYSVYDRVKPDECGPYPLIGGADEIDPDHLHFYINAVHAANQERK